MTRFSVKDNVVLDTTTGLYWQQAVVPEGMSWEKAKEYAANLRLDGYSDWRLPTAHELFGIVDLSKCRPCIDREIFPDTMAEEFWSVSINAYDANDAWFVDFYSGAVSYIEQDKFYSVRCVR